MLASCLTSVTLMIGHIRIGRICIGHTLQLIGYQVVVSLVGVCLTESFPHLRRHDPCSYLSISFTGGIFRLSALPPTPPPTPKSSYAAATAKKPFSPMTPPILIRFRKYQPHQRSGKQNQNYQSEFIIIPPVETNFRKLKKPTQSFLTRCSSRAKSINL